MISHQVFETCWTHAVLSHLRLNAFLVSASQKKTIPDFLPKYSVITQCQIVLKYVLCDLFMNDVGCIFLFDLRKSFSIGFFVWKIGLFLLFNR